MIGRSPFGQGGAVAGRLRDIDPRVMIVTFLLLIIFTFIVPHSSGLVVLASYVTALAILGGYKLSMIVGRLRPLLYFLVFILVLNAILVGGHPLPEPFAFMSVDGLRSGIYLGLRVVVIYLAGLVFLTVVSQEAVAQGVAALIAPFSRTWADRMALYGFLSVGFVPLFTDEFNRIRIAQRFRGGALESGWRGRLESVRVLLVPLLMSAIHRSGQLALAVEIRGIKRTIRNLLVLKAPGRRDYAFGAFSLTIFFVATLA